MLQFTMTSASHYGDINAKRWRERQNDLKRQGQKRFPGHGGRVYTFAAFKQNNNNKLRRSQSIKSSVPFLLIVFANVNCFPLKIILCLNYVCKYASHPCRKEVFLLHFWLVECSVFLFYLSVTSWNNLYIYGICVCSC